ncbi:MAG TPA: DUF4131 domain-containing protein, partial [Caldilineaceae bacterium]|nr:DUF4131 domain-containing protein [Caldilineaceae bacterium]
MTLFYLAVAYIAGIVAGRLAWEAGWLGCETSAWLWGIPLALLPFAPLAGHFGRAPAPPPLRWPASAGFEPPQPLFTPGLRAALLLCTLAGALRYAAVPLVPCPASAGLLAWHGTSEPVTVTGYIANYPVVSEGRQRLRLAVERITVAGAGHPVTGLVQLTTGASPRYRY